MTKRLSDFGRVEGLVVGVHGEGFPDMLGFIGRIIDRSAETVKLDSPKTSFLDFKRGYSASPQVIDLKFSQFRIWI